MSCRLFARFAVAACLFATPAVVAQNLTNLVVDEWRAPVPSGLDPLEIPPNVSTNRRTELRFIIEVLKTHLTDRETWTAENIKPLGSLQEIRDRLAECRARVDLMVRQPFLSGINPPPELLLRTKGWQDRWGTLSDAIREGRVPENVPGDVLRKLQLRSFPVPAAGNVTMAGALWAGLANDYFDDTARVERMAEMGSARVRGNEPIPQLVTMVEVAEEKFKAGEKDPYVAEDPAFRRELTWRIHKIWRTATEYQIKRYERELNGSLYERALETLIYQADAARAYRHRGLAADATGSNAAPTLLKEVPLSPNGTPNLPNRLPVMAAELYHVHYLLQNIDSFVAEDEAAEIRKLMESKARQGAIDRKKADQAVARSKVIAELKKTFEARRAQVVLDIQRETDLIIRARM